ncbi:MAG: hypothetical protein HKO84_05670 [Pseudomonadales bacterium]|nr:hypothetical protein [Pseudomonadales bacterium]
MNKKRLFFVASIILALVLSAKFGLSKYREAAKNNNAFFESEIMAFEHADMQSPPKPGSIVFVGSSSIRFWKTLASDMAPLPIIRRGFGGAHMSHVLYNFDRIIMPYQPKAVVVFVGGNDIGSGKSAQRLISDYQKFIDMLEKKLPNTDLWILSMKPSKARWEHWPQMLEVDKALSAVALRDDKITFVDAGQSLLTEDGRPDDVYVFDGLHLNQEGYRRWTDVLKPLLLDKYISDS